MEKPLETCRPSRRTVLAASILSPLLLASCSKPSASRTESWTGPVTVEHAFGQTTIDSSPQTIATLGRTSADICAALGVSPAAMPFSEQSPWLTLQLKDLAASTPQLYSDNPEMPLDALTELKPDVILAVNSDISRLEYVQLSRIAPVVAFPQRPLDTPWRDSVMLIAEALGIESKGQDLLKSVEDDIAESLAPYSDLTGTSFLVGDISEAIG